MEALGALERAAQLRPDNPHYGYVFGVALHSTHQSTRALEVLKQAHERHPGEPELLVGLATISRERGQLASAIDYARKLVELVPYDQGRGSSSLSWRHSGVSRATDATSSSC